MKPVTYATWTPEMVLTLRDCAARQLTAGQIVTAINAKHSIALTRGAIIGKCWRLGVALTSREKAQKTIGEVCEI